MIRPLTRPLVKVFANGFYRENTGLLLTLFILVFSNFFYTNVLNQTHLTHAELIQNALKLVINSVSEPLGVVLLFSIFSVYSLKSWQYVVKRLENTDVQFLFYSLNAAGWKQQLKSWLVTQFIISLPIVVVGLYAVIVGVLFGYCLAPCLIVIYLIGLNVYGAFRYTRILNNTLVSPFVAADIAWMKNWPKPLYSLFVYEIVARKRLAYLTTKIASLVSVLLIFKVFNEAQSDFRLFGIIGMCSAVSHIILVYQANEFDQICVRFSRNFPYSQWQIYSRKLILWTLILLPEIIWFLLVGKSGSGLAGAFLMVSLVLLFYAIAKLVRRRMYYYLRLVFALFIVLLLLNLFGLTLWLVVTNLAAAWALLHRYHNRPEME